MRSGPHNHLFIYTVATRLHRFGIWILCVLFAGTLHAQDSPITNVVNEYGQVYDGNRKVDTAYIRQLLRAASAMQKNSVDSALPLYAKAAMLARRIYYYHGAGVALQMQGLAYYRRGNYKEAINHYQAAVIQYQRDGFYRPDNSNTRWNKNGIVSTYSNMGHVYLMQGSYAKATDYYFLALQTAVATDHDPITIGTIYNLLGIVYIHLKDYDQALPYLYQSEAILMGQQYESGLANVLSNIAIVFYNQKKYDTAMSYGIRASIAAEKSSNQQELYQAANVMGGIYNAINQPEKAIPYFQKAYAFAQKVGMYEQSSALYYMGTAYLSLNDFEKAEHYMLDALQIASDINTRSHKLEVFKGLADLYKKKGEYAKAISYQEQYRTLADSLGDESLHTIQQLETKYKSAIKDKEIANKQTLIARQEVSIERKNAWIGYILAGVILLIVLFFIRHMIYLRKQRLQKEKIATLEKEKVAEVQDAKEKAEEMERARIALELHDGITGALSVVKMRLSTLHDKNGNLATTDDFSNTISLLDEVINDIRSTAHNLLPETLLQFGFVNAISAFCEHVNKGDKLQISIQPYGDFHNLPATLQLSVYRIIQELIQNILKYAQATQALIQLSIWENLFSVTIEDNGIGFDADAKGRGMGHKNIYLRVKALNGFINIQSKQGKGTNVYMEFDLQKQQPT